MLRQLAPRAHDPHVAPTTMSLHLDRYGVSTVRQLRELRTNWIAFRSVIAALRHEEYLYVAGVDVYATATNRWALLRERIGSIVSQEHKDWNMPAIHNRGARERLSRPSLTVH